MFSFSASASRSETHLRRAAEAAGSAPACQYETSADLHAEAVRRWRAAHARPAFAGLHVLSVACLTLVLCIA
jgi:hypothetical protein